MSTTNKCSLDTSSNELEILLRQLKRELAELVKSTEYKLLQHDGKIAEMCVYLKTNLSNSIRELLDTMLTNGEIDNIILETITNLEPLISNLTKDVDNVKNVICRNMKFYLPNGMDYTYGQLMLLGISDNAACLFDTGHPDDVDKNLSYLRSKLNGKKLDYVIISHYHADHTGGLDNFTELYDKSTKFYIAKDPSGYYAGSDLAELTADRNNIISYLIRNGFNYTEINSDLRLDIDNGIALNLLNNTDGAFTYYKSITTDYNNFSLVIDCEVDNKHVLIGFDGAEYTQKYLNNKNEVTKAEVLFNFHHGNYNKCDREYMLKLNPDIVVDTLPPVNMGNFDGTESSTERPLYNAKLLSNARNEVIIDVNSFSVEVEKGDNKVDFIRNHGNVEVYLNPDYTGLECIGTYEKPFKTFNQIFELIPKSCQTVTVNVSGSKMLTNQRLYNTFNKLIIKGNAGNKTIFTNIQIDNCTKVEFTNIKFTENIVYLYNSDVRFTDCDFDIKKEQNLNITNSRVSCIKCKFLNATREGILAGDKSILRLSECSIDAPTYGVSTTSSTLYINKNTITGTTNYYRVADDSQIIGPKVGNSSERPNLGKSYYCNGYTYFDSELNRLIYFDSDGTVSNWKTTDGIDV